MGANGPRNRGRPGPNDDDLRNTSDAAVADLVIGWKELLSSRSLTTTKYMISIVGRNSSPVLTSALPAFP